MKKHWCHCSRNNKLVIKSDSFKIKRYSYFTGLTAYYKYRTLFTTINDDLIMMVRIKTLY